MKYLNKIILLVILALVMLLGQSVSASNLASSIQPMEFTEEYKAYLELSYEEQQNLLEPRMFEISETTIESLNPLFLTYSLKSSLKSSYSLEDIIPENVVVKNQEDTMSCWAFATLSSLETNLALNNYNNGLTAKTYDFSERHMEYATTKTFTNNETNDYGFDRTPDEGGFFYIAAAYLTNGSGAIDEEDMPFENNEDLINLSEIQNKTVTTQVYDTVEFPSYSVDEDTTEIKKQMKEHIYKYGSIFAGIYGAEIFSDYYNNSTGALYCDDSEACPVDHAVAIIGWDDDYSIENFNEENRPESNGAWIVKNSWGTELEYDLTELKEQYFEENEKYFKGIEIETADEIPDAYIETLGYAVEGDSAYLPLGDEGLMYVSYEDVNIYSYLSGIEKAEDSVSYENIYQYNYLGGIGAVSLASDTVYLGTIFTREDVSEVEYLTQISLNSAQAASCTVYVNPNGTSLEEDDLQIVELVAGSSESFDVGYHTLEFLNPVELNSSSFAVVVRLESSDGSGTMIISGEPDIEGSFFEGVDLSSGKCFMTTDSKFGNNEWIDTAQLSQLDSSLYSMDTTIKAFTTSENIGNNSEEDNNGNNSEEDNEDDSEEDNIENSNFDDSNCDVKSVKAYYFTDTSIEEYVLMDIEINNVLRNTSNDSYEYYYYLSPKQAEENITDWIKIEESQTYENKLEFIIDTRDITNLEELENSEVAYIYIKEIAIKNENQKSIISNAMLLESNVEIETYLDNNLQTNLGEEDNNSNYNSVLVDNTVTTTTLPDTGIKLTIIISIIVVTTLGVVGFLRYKKMKEI